MRKFFMYVYNYILLVIIINVIISESLVPACSGAQDIIYSKSLARTVTLFVILYSEKKNKNIFKKIS